MELLVRFVLGGLIVSVFAAIGEAFQPKTFSGLFGAAPSVALASLALAFHQHDATYVATLARWMIVGALALFVYCAVCVVIVRRARRDRAAPRARPLARDADLGRGGRDPVADPLGGRRPPGS